MRTYLDAANSIIFKLLLGVCDMVMIIFFCQSKGEGVKVAKAIEDARKSNSSGKMMEEEQ